MADEDCDVFEISDFTNASDWEKFITQIEQVIRELKLTDQTAQGPLRKGELATNKWTQTKKQINFNKVAFVATKYEMVREELEENDEYVDLDDKEEPMITALQDMMSHFNDFQSAGPPLSTWYGLRCFVVLNPSDEPVTMESKIKILLSSVNIAIANTGCSVPVFVEAHHPSRNLHYGQCVSASLRTDFEMIHSQRIPRQYYHLNGLLDLFKAKLSSSNSGLPSVKLSAMLTYCLKDWKDYAWTHVPLDFDRSIDDDYRHPFGYLPMGACREPMSKLFLSTTWLGLSEEMIVDNDTYTDLDPLQAPMWSVLVKMTDDPQCLLDECISKFQALCLSKETMEQLIGRWMEDEDQEQGDVAQALNKLTEPVPYYIPTLSDVVNQATTRIRVRQRDPGLSMNLLNDILLYLFPDAKVDDKKDERKAASSEYKDILKHWKSAPLDSLSYKVALCLCIVNATYGGIRAVAHLWQEFVYEMRYRWENAILIPDISTDNPDLATCLLHQKLQMLNCCIQKKQNRDKRQRNCDAVSEATTSSDAEAPSTSATESSGLDVKVIGSSDSDDDFFECEESMETETENLEEQSTDESKTSKDSVRLHKADGRKEPFDDNKLLNCDELIYIPHTQDPAPLTEDMLDEQLEIMAKLGTSAEAAHRRALMQSGSLLSDMESFKAANPGCVLEDFVRWYSPRDYEVVAVRSDDGQETTTGQLSARMRIPGNMWSDCWQSAKPIPCRRQKRLFNDTKEAEKVLHFLGNMRPAEVACHLMPIVITAAVVRLLEVEKKDRVPMTERLLKNISVCSDRGQLMKEQNFLPMIRFIREVEISNARANSLRTKLYEHLTNRRSSKVAFPEEELDEPPNPEIENLVCELVEGKEVTVVGAVRSVSGKILHSMFIASQRSLLGDEESDQSGKPTASVPDFPKPVAKQFILRCNVPRPAPYSRPSPQRLLCAISDHEVRFAGAFTIDTTFV